jgi:hypothetical protein
MQEDMTDKTISDPCLDPTLSLTIELPCRMVERVERYAKEKGTTAAGVFIEALDEFLRRAG